MNKSILLSLALGLLPIANAQVVNWCKDDECGDCPSSVTPGESRWPECVIYDSETVFGGQGFQESELPNFKFDVFGNFLEAPCGDENGAVIVRSPAALDVEGCGKAIVARSQTGCLESPIQLEETFMVQYCCGVGECGNLNIPVPSRRAIGGHTKRDDSPFGIAAAGGGGRGLYMTYKNGTIIPPKAVGSPPTLRQLARAAAVDRRQECDTWQQGSYVANGEVRYVQFDTIIISATIGPFTEDTLFTETYDETIEVSTTFELSVGDPLGIISASLGITFARSETKGRQYQITVPAGVSGRVGFTPIYACTTGTLTDCDGNVSDETETCAPWKPQNGPVQGDYSIVQS